MQSAIQNIPSATVIGRDIALEMADAMREIGEGATREDLKRKHFTDRQINRYGEEARAIADKRVARRIG
jgi:hypothetical protein